MAILETIRAEAEAHRREAVREGYDPYELGYWMGACHTLDDLEQRWKRVTPKHRMKPGEEFTGGQT